MIKLDNKLKTVAAEILMLLFVFKFRFLISYIKTYMYINGYMVMLILFKTNSTNTMQL